MQVRGPGSQTPCAGVPEGREHRGSRPAERLPQEARDYGQIVNSIPSVRPIPKASSGSRKYAWA